MYSQEQSAELCRLQDQKYLTALIQNLEIAIASKDPCERAIPILERALIYLRGE